MKIKTISRKEENYTRSDKSEIYRVQRNYDPAQHPFEKAREYTRAMNATKMERMFAKPFIASLDGHRDGVYCMAKHPTLLTSLISGACDGEIKVWDLGVLKEDITIEAHRGYVRGLTIAPYGESFMSVGDDKTIKQWDLESMLRNGSQNDMPSELGVGLDEFEATPKYRYTPKNVWLGVHAFSGVDHHRRKGVFATSGAEVVEVWDQHRSEPIHEFKWGVDSVTTVKFNPVEVDVFASCATDRSVVLYDLRSGSSLQKLILGMRSNAVCWNPMEAFNFTVANEDHNLYTFDMRKMDKALNVHKDHVSAVLAVDYSPTGRELVSGGYDKSLRIFGNNQGHSREVYHTKRMQRVFSVLFSQDAKYVLSGSDETNIRVWKANASEKMGPMAPRQRVAVEYANELKERFQHHPEIKRIARHRHVPKAIRSAAAKKRIITESERRKKNNKRAHSKPGTIKDVPERKKHVVATQD
ncbi:DDB1- and CUL4-associated factor 13 [Sphaeroforma arctica JP610]|uniref:DDB1- and CUL4-associated factor 13 n=1 Tax=Sphaeroforma arctica JP610 TaxID=667725 RepID=A0A0L0GDI3_9EUKA|nr:DDB1- and CUL4-associated factor 13 [Sphaeroforma arctica JP610]KNC86951.1 DDB1- and CUL4-associated factor 13 [Sphaeroforma arctica JP610]|eukprot:XP_014160853.1 DDB1- and CUL4-associated factor 13 [Sphaeroforma arctica JP610]